MTKRILFLILLITAIPMITIGFLVETVIVIPAWVFAGKYIGYFSDNGTKDPFIVKLYVDVLTNLLR